MRKLFLFAAALAGLNAPAAGIVCEDPWGGSASLQLNGKTLAIEFSHPRWKKMSLASRGAWTDGKYYFRDSAGVARVVLKAEILAGAPGHFYILQPGGKRSGGYYVGYRCWGEG